MRVLEVRARVIAVVLPVGNTNPTAEPLTAQGDWGDASRNAVDSEARGLGREAFLTVMSAISVSRAALCESRGEVRCAFSRQPLPAEVLRVE